MSFSDGQRSRGRFTDEFKTEAVSMVEASSGQIANVARELHVHESSLSNWVRKSREKVPDPLTMVEREEIRLLKKELERVRRERDILGKSRSLLLSVETKGTGKSNLLVYSWKAD